MYTYPWYHWLTFFYIYCFFGWVFESTYVSLSKRRFINRGFLRLPMLPLYGTGAVMMLWVSMPYQDNLLLVYISGVFATTILEYVTGYVMERLFKVKYWDYSNQKFQLHGYICLSSSIAWGFLTIFLTHVIHRPIENFVLGLNPAVEFSLIGVISLLFVADSIQSTKAALNLGRTLEALTRIRVELEELQVQLALLKAETVTKVAEIRSDATQKVADAREDASQRMTDIKTTAASKMAAVAQMVTEYGEHQEEREQLLSERFKSLSDNFHTLTHQKSFYRKGLLQGNPSASSRKFAEALKELKEITNSRHKS